MNVIVGCECSQIVTSAFRKLGHNAWSCDIIDSEGDYPEYHHKGDVLEFIKKSDIKWDLGIFHPPCTYLSLSSVSALYHDGSKFKKKNPNVKYGIDRWVALYDGAIFFKELLNLPIPRIAVENPIPHRFTVGYIGRKYDQIIQPWMFGHKESKATCLWLKSLPKLTETNNVKVEMSELQRKESQKIHWMSPGPERAKKRSITFAGIAKAMANTWG
jgi:hypothetical protein